MSPRRRADPDVWLGPRTLPESMWGRPPRRSFRRTWLAARVCEVPRGNVSCGTFAGTRTRPHVVAAAYMYRLGIQRHRCVTPKGAGGWHAEPVSPWHPPPSGARLIGYTAKCTRQTRHGRGGPPSSHRARCHRGPLRGSRGRDGRRRSPHIRCRGTGPRLRRPRSPRDSFSRLWPQGKPTAHVSGRLHGDYTHTSSRAEHPFHRQRCCGRFCLTARIRAGLDPRGYRGGSPSQGYAPSRLLPLRPALLSLKWSERLGCDSHW